MLRRIISLMVCAFVTVSLFAGCTKAEDKGKSAALNAESTAAKPKEPVTITFWFPTEDKVNDEYFTNVGKEFTKLHPEINVEVTLLPATSADVEVKMSAASMAGQYPDVVSLFLAVFNSRGPRGELYDLTPSIAKWSDKSDIYESAISNGTIKGKTLGLGFYPAPEILTYRKDFFKEAGLDPEKPPKNWTELGDYARKLTKRDANGNVTRAGFDIPAVNVSPFTKAFFRQGGSVVVDEDKEIPLIADAGAISAYTFLGGLIKEKTNIPYDYQKKDTIPFVKGNAAMSLLQPTQITMMINNDPTMKEKLGFAPVLEEKKKIAFCGNRMLAIGEKSKYKEQAWEFLQFLMSKEQMMARSKNLKMPAVRKSLEAEYIKLDPALNTVILDYAKNGKGAESVTWVGALNKAMETSFQEVSTGKSAPEKALKDAEDALKKEVENTKK